MRSISVAICLAVAVLCSGAESGYTIRTVAGSDLVGDNGPATLAQIAQPEGLAIDAAGNLYIADAAAHCVRKLSPAGVITTVAGTGRPGFSGDGGVAVNARLREPYDVAVDAAGNLYIADYGNQRIRVVTTDGRIRTIAGDPENGSLADGTPAVSARLQGPRNLAVDSSGNVYISEFDGHRLRRIDSTGTVTTIAGTGKSGFSGDGGSATIAQLAYPAGLTVDSSGAIYFADTGNNRIRKVVAGTIGTYIDNRRIATPTGPAGYYTGSMLLTIRAAPGGDLLFVTDSLIFRVHSGAVELVAGVPGNGGPGVDGKPASATMLAAPQDVVVDPEGNMYVAERGRLRRIDGSSGVIRTIAGDGTFGFRGDGGAATQAHLRGPTGLLFNAGELLITDTGNHRVRRVAVDGTIGTIAGNGNTAVFDRPQAVAIDTSGRLLVADTGNNLVRAVLASGALTTVAGGAQPLISPQGLATGSGGQVYVSDSGQHRVLRIDASARITAVAGAPGGGDSGDGGSAATAQLNQPRGLAAGAAGNLFIADFGNHRVRRVDPSGRIETVAGTGSSGFSGDGGPAREAQLSFPCAVAVDQGRNLYIADSGNHVIRQVTPDGRIATIAGRGRAGFSGDEPGSAAEAFLDTPCGIAVGLNGDLYIADTGNDRVRMLTLLPENLVEPPPAELQAGLTVRHAASMEEGAVAPGELVVIWGAGSVEAASLLVVFDGRPAPVIASSAEQITAQVPYSVARQAVTELEVLSRGVSRGRVRLPVVAARPGLFAAGGHGPALAGNQDGSQNSDTNPAPRGSVVSFYATGEGSGQPSVSVNIGGNPAEVVFAGPAPGLIGVFQINARVAGGYEPGVLPVTVTVAGAASQPGVTLAIQ